MEDGKGPTDIGSALLLISASSNRVATGDGAVSIEGASIQPVNGLSHSPLEPFWAAMGMRSILLAGSEHEFGQQIKLTLHLCKIAYEKNQSKGKKTF